MRLWQLIHSVTRSMLSGYSHYSTIDFRYICVVSNACYVLLLYCYTKNVYFKNKLNVRHTYIYILMDSVIKWKEIYLSRWINWICITPLLLIDIVFSWIIIIYKSVHVERNVLHYLRTKLNGIGIYTSYVIK